MMLSVHSSLSSPTPQKESRRWVRRKIEERAKGKRGNHNIMFAQSFVVGFMFCFVLLLFCQEPGMIVLLMSLSFHIPIVDDSQYILPVLSIDISPPPQTAVDIQ